MTRRAQEKGAGNKRFGQREWVEDMKAPLRFISPEERAKMIKANSETKELIAQYKQAKLYKVRKGTVDTPAKDSAFRLEVSHAGNTKEVDLTSEKMFKALIKGLK